MTPRNLSHGCFPHLFEAQVERTPEAIAVTYKDRSLTYRELNRRANQVSHHLIDFGIGPESLVGICMEREPEMMVGLLGILKTGAAYLPLDTSYPTERLSYMLDDAGTAVVLTQKKVLDKIPRRTAAAICLDEDWPAIAERSGENPATGVAPDNLAYVIYTSGSTGKPKGVMIHHRGLANYLCWASRFYRMAEGRGSLVHSPIGFDLTITTLFAPLLVGQRVVLLPEGFGIEELVSALRAGKDFSVVKITPSHLEALTYLLPPKEMAGRARVLVIGGEMLRWEHISSWRKNAPGTRLVNEYGPTETVVGCCIYEVAGDAVTAGSVPIGRAIDNMEMVLLGPDLQPICPGEIGELYIGGVGLARGYLNQPETTEAKFIPHPLDGSSGARLYKSGDLARYLPDGNLEYLGRTDQQVKVRGFRIELGEIEVALAQHPGVSDCVVVAREDAAASASLRTGPRLVAYTASKTTIAPTADELRSFLQERLPAHMVPAVFVSLDAFPITVNGKIDRDALPAPGQQRPALEMSFKAAADPLEIELIEIWEEILGVRPIGASDNFFELGGDSLKAVLMVTRLEEIRGRQIPPSLLIAGNTVEKLAAAIHRQDYEPRSTTVVPVQPKGELPPLFLVGGIGGLVIGLSYLGRRLGSDQPLYGLQARGLRDSESPCSSIEEMTQYYIDAVQAAQPEGPLFIGGYSFGGIVAFEMARQLHSVGRQIGILAILDTIAPGPQRLSFSSFVRNLPHWLDRYIRRRGLRDIAYDGWRKLKQVSKSGIHTILRPFGADPQRENIAEAIDLPDGLPERYRRIFEAHYQALLNYKPESYPGLLTLFRTEAQPLFRAYGLDNGWDRLAQGGVEIYPIEGNHLNFLEEPHVRFLAEQMRSALEKSRNRTSMGIQPVANVEEQEKASPPSPSVYETLPEG
jgi:amino acid adenylation domain-containing protein